MNKDVSYIYIQWNISHKKNETLPFATTYMDQEGMVLHEVSQRER